MSDAVTHVRASLAAAAAHERSERMAVEAAREAAIDPERRAVARLLGVKPDEIEEVRVAGAGDTITRSDRTVIALLPGDVIVTSRDAQSPRMIAVSAQHPDGEGRHGLLMLDPPKYPAVLPLFVPRPSPDTAW